MAGIIDAHQDPAPEPVTYWDVPYVSSILGVTPRSLRKAALRGSVTPPPDAWIAQLPGWRPFDPASFKLTGTGTGTGTAADPGSAEPTILLSLAEVAERLGFEYATLKAYRRDGLFPQPDGQIGRLLGWLPTTADTWQLDRSYNVPHRRPAIEPTPPREVFLPLREVAKQLGIAHSTARARLQTGAIPQPSVQIGNALGWSTAALEAARASAPAAPAPQRRFYTASELAHMYRLSPAAITLAQRAGRWPAPDAQCGQTVGWALETIEAVRGPVPTSALSENAS